MHHLHIYPTKSLQDRYLDAEMNPSQHTQVLIIGGGIGGLTLAALCKKLNISCLVLERSKKISPVGAGISLAPNALRVLDQLGLYDDFVRDGQSLDKILIHRNRTKWRTLDFTCVNSSFGYPVYSIERHRFHHLLYQAAEGDETVILDSTVAEIVDNPAAPYVSVKLGNGGQINADVAVGADGIRSVTRRILARQAGLDAKNTIRFTGRVHMSGYTAPIENLGPKDLGVGNWLFYDDAILTTWPCVDNRQWFIGVKVGSSSLRIGKIYADWKVVESWASPSKRNWSFSLGKSNPHHGERCLWW